MQLPERRLEQFFYHGCPTEALTLFARALLTIANDGEDWKRLRKPETLDAMLARREKEGVVAMKAEILQAMDGSVAFVRNIFPYDGIFPQGSQLFHTCLYSTKEPLSPDVVTAQIVRFFPGRSAVVFENSEKHKTIALPHYHVVLDQGK